MIPQSCPSEGKEARHLYSCFSLNFCCWPSEEPVYMDLLSIKGEVCMPFPKAATFLLFVCLALFCFFKTE